MSYYYSDSLYFINLMCLMAYSSLKPSFTKLLTFSAYF